MKNDAKNNKDDAKDKKDRRESGVPGGGAGRREDVRGSGVFPASGPHPPGEAPVVGQAEWGQGARGAQGYQDHGGGEVYNPETHPEKCRDLMTKNPVCVTGTETAEGIARLMKQHDTGFIPVVEDMESRKLAGVVTDRDIVLRVLAQRRNPAEALAREVMSREPLTCSPDNDIDQAIEAMERRQVRRLPIVDQEKRLVGVIAQADIALRLRERLKTAEVVERVSKPKAFGGGG